MSTKQVQAWLEDVLDDLARRILAPTDDGQTTRPAVVHAVHRLFDARPALPGAQAFDSDRVTSSGSASNPPPGFGATDTAQADRDEAHRRAKRMRDDADWFVRMIVRTNPRHPSPKDRSLSAANEREEPECARCRTIGKWSRARQGATATTVNGNLPEPMALCAFCYAFTRDTGALPSRKQLEDHHNGIRVRRNVPPQGMSA